MFDSKFAKLSIVWFTLVVPALMTGRALATFPLQETKQQETSKAAEEGDQVGKAQQADDDQSVAGEAKEAGVDEWTRFELADTPASVLMPGVPAKTTRTVEAVLDQPSVTVTGLRKAINEGKAMVSISFTPLHDKMVDFKHRQETLKWAEKNSIAAVLATAPLTSKEVRRQNHLGREFTFEFTHESPKTKTVVNWKCHSAIYIVGQQFFELSVIQRADTYDDELPSKFLDSLEFAKQ